MQERKHVEEMRNKSSLQLKQTHVTIDLIDIRTQSKTGKVTVKETKKMDISYLTRIWVSQQVHRISKLSLNWDILLNCNGLFGAGLLLLLFTKNIKNT